MKTTLPDKFSTWKPCEREDIKLDNFTTVPNVFFNVDHLLTGEESKVLNFLIRLSYGFGTRDLRITLRQISKGVRLGSLIIFGTNSNRKTVQCAINLFEEIGILTLREMNDPDENHGNLYTINEDNINIEYLLERVKVKEDRKVKEKREEYKVESEEVVQFKDIVNAVDNHTVQSPIIPTVHSLDTPTVQPLGYLIKIKENKENIYASQFKTSLAINKESMVNRVNINTVVNAKEEFKELEYVPAEGTREFDILERRERKQERYRARAEKSGKHVSAVVCGVPYEIDWFPDDVIMVVKKFCQIWRIIPPKTRSQMSYWIIGARELKDACAEYEDAIILELKKEQDKEIEEGKSPLNVSSPRSLVQRAMNKARIWREEDYKKKLAGQ